MQWTSGIGFTRMGIACWWNDYSHVGMGAAPVHAGGPGCQVLKARF
jgi:hypothetical protein